MRIRAPGPSRNAAIGTAGSPKCVLKSSRAAGKRPSPEPFDASDRSASSAHSPRTYSSARRGTESPASLTRSDTSPLRSSPARAQRVRRRHATRRSDTMSNPALPAPPVETANTCSSGSSIVGSTSALVRARITSPSRANRSAAISDPRARRAGRGRCFPSAFPP